MDAITIERNVLNDFVNWLEANGIHITKDIFHLSGHTLVNKYMSANLDKNLKIEDDYVPKTEAEIDAYLRDAGYDPEQVGRMGVKVALAATDQSPLNPKNVKIADLEKKLKMAEGLLMSDQFKMTRLQEQLTIAQEFRKLVEMLPPDSYLMHCPVTNQVAWQAIAGDIDSPDCKIAWGDTPLETLQKLIPMLKENNHGTTPDHR